MAPGGAWSVQAWAVAGPAHALAWASTRVGCQEDGKGTDVRAAARPIEAAAQSLGREGPSGAAAPSRLPRAAQSEARHGRSAAAAHSIMPAVGLEALAIGRAGMRPAR